jgi:hypothetical protein
LEASVTTNRFLTALLFAILAGCSPPTRDDLNESIVARYGEGSRLMVGDDATSQAIIDRYCLAECKDDAELEHVPGDKYKCGWRPWLCGPIPHTYTLRQNQDGTYRIRYKPANLDEGGSPRDVWEHVGVKNVEMAEFMEAMR